jgi:hypothetical protein
MDTTTIEQVINYLLFILSVAGAVTVLIEQLKPFVFEPILNRYGERPYLAAMYATRTFGGFFALIMFGGYQTIQSILPLVDNVSELAVLFGSSLLVALNTEFVHVFLDFLYALRDLRRETVTQSVVAEVTTSGSSTGTVSGGSANLADLLARFPVTPSVTTGLPEVKVEVNTPRENEVLG